MVEEDQGHPLVEAVVGEEGLGSKVRLQLKALVVVEVVEEELSCLVEGEVVVGVAFHLTQQP